MKTLLQKLAYLLLFIICVLSGFIANAQQNKFPRAGADSLTPSRSHFFDWINSQYEGTTEKQTLANLDFFHWLNKEYGMKLDIYSLDVGNIDDGPYTAGVGRLIPYHYGSMKSREFKEQFPNGFAPLVEKADSFGCRLGIWLGPDGFGTTPEEEKTRSEMMIQFCRDFNFHLFKLDGVAGTFRPEKAEILSKTLQKCREYTPDLIVSSQRVDFKDAEPDITHHLWEGEETYVDVFINNHSTAPHHRAGSLERKLTPNLSRLYGDHGVCFSSCLDYWEDEMVLQMFNRSLILSPQFYGNPWFLRDDEFPKFARLINIHRKYRDVIVEGFQLPEEQYGPYAMSRGDEKTRFLTLRNLSWETKTYEIDLDESIGLEKAESLNIQKFHPSEKWLGEYKWGNTIKVEVEPYRSYLIKISSTENNEIIVDGCDYEIVRNTPDKSTLIKLVGNPGTSAKIKIQSPGKEFSSGILNGVEIPFNKLKKGVDVLFPGEKMKKSSHRKIGIPTRLEKVPDDAEALFEATCFAADNNALEVRCIDRSGESTNPVVNKCRQEFFEKPMFVNRGIWDKNLFDGDLNTFFIARLAGKMFRLDLGEKQEVDEIIIRIRDRQEHNLNPEMNSFDEVAFAEVSSDLVKWDTVRMDYKGYGTIARVVPRKNPIRYLRITGAPRRMAEIEAYKNDTALKRDKWRASNLFGNYASNPAIGTWSMKFKLDEIPPESYLVVALNGKHGNEGAYAALKIDGEIVGAPDRAVSYPSNTWEYFNVDSETDYTYYFPLKEDEVGKDIEVFILGLEKGVAEFNPEVWITAYPGYQQEIQLELK